MVYYEPVKDTIDASKLVEVILDMVIWHHSLPDTIMSDRGLLFTSKLWSSLCYFFGNKKKLSITFHLQTDSQTKRQNSKMEAYLQLFINFEQNDQAKLLLIAEFTYKNTKNASIGQMLFQLNCGYHSWMSYKE